VRKREDHQEVEKIKERCGRIAAFFDLDGTLAALPSLERRFFRTLRYWRQIPAKNYLLWLREAVRLMPRGLKAILQADKMYLQGVESYDERGQRHRNASPWHKGGHQAKGQASVPPRRNPRLPVPSFFLEAIKRVAWHATQGHAIVLVSGTLEPLAQGAAKAMEEELAGLGILLTIRVCATKLEEVDGRWTGRILGEAMFDEAKVQAVKRIAVESSFDLAQCYAYGDSANDRHLLAAVGRPTAVNPSSEFERIARKQRWPVLRWKKEAIHSQRRGGRREDIGKVESVFQPQEVEDSRLQAGSLE
jgi:HAD superfamily hydrolase (TIGR01490 family)